MWRDVNSWWEGFYVGSIASSVSMVLVAIVIFLFLKGP